MKSSWFSLVWLVRTYSVQSTCLLGVYHDTLHILARDGAELAELTGSNGSYNGVAAAVRFYSGGCDAAYVPESEACSQTIMNQAHQTLDFSQVVERAWADGVRVFIEHGPMGACSSWIRDVLGDRVSEAVVVPLDREGHGIETIFEAVAALINYTTLIVIGLYLVYEAAMRFANPEPVAGWIVVIVAGIALLVDLGTAALTFRASKSSVNIRAAFLHNVADALGSVAVIVASSAESSQ